MTPESEISFHPTFCINSQMSQCALEMTALYSLYGLLRGII